MSLLQPWMLFALPLAALPIIIHLINQRRFQTVDWAAMNFLLAANQMDRGYAKLRQWLILAMRTLAILTLIIAVSRPLSDGWLGLAAGSRVDTTFVLLDRSPSMMQTGPGGMTKFETGRRRLIDTLGTVRSNRFVLVDSRSGETIELESAEDLMDLPAASASSASVDLPAMLQTTAEYIQANRPGRSEVWICSDVRRNDWDDSGGRWEAIRASFVDTPQPVRFHLLAYADSAAENRSVRVTDVRRVERDGAAQLLVSLVVTQSQPDPSSGADPVKVPIRMTLDGAAGEFEIEMRGGEVEVKDHAVPLDASQKRGWGKVSIASDENVSDNEFFFVYDEPAERRTLVVSDDPDRAQPLVFAASIPPDQSVTCSAEVVSSDRVVGVDWDDLALVLWHAPLPTGDIAKQLEWFVTRGGKVIFFPPENTGEASFAGVSWGGWRPEPKGLLVATWTGDQDLLGNVNSGASLPVGTLKVLRHCELIGKQLPLATLSGGAPLLARAVTDQRNVYFCTTTISAADSSLATEGVVLYAMIQRAVAGGAESLGQTRELVAGTEVDDSAAQWQQIAGDDETLSTAYTQHAGVYRAGEKLFAVNRAVGEDSTAVVQDDQVATLFAGLAFDRIDDVAGSDVSLVQEIWQLVLGLMLLALLVEAVLCIPRRPAAVVAQAVAPKPLTAGFETSEGAAA